MMNRRSILKSLIGAGSVAAGNYLFRNPLITAAQAQSTITPCVVVVFQRGGCDGLNEVIPFGDAEYYRPDFRPNIAIPHPESGLPNPAIPFHASDDPAYYFGLQPSLEPLMGIWNQNDLAVLPTVQYDNATRSHFDGQHRIESASRRDDLDGWLNRHLQTSSLSGQLQAAHFGGSLAQSLRGDIPVSSFSFINSFSLGLNSTDETSLSNAVLPIYNATPSPATAYQQLVHQYGQVLFNNLDVVQNIDTDSYVPNTDPAYPYPNSSYGRRLREIAQLIKTGVGLEAATVDIGGWDTHSNQGNGDPNGRQSRSFAQFASGIRALYDDLGPAMDNVVILTMTEFGRTSFENGSMGTDHGNATTWFAAGANIAGGVYTGDAGWPGVATDQLQFGRYLQHTIDYRNIFGDILVNHMGHSETALSFLIPEHDYNPVNIFGTTSTSV